MLTLLEDKIDTPLGPLWIIADEASRLRAVEWEEHSDRMEQLLAIHYRQEGFRRVGCVNPGGLSDALRAANGSNPISIVVPCHRVIGRNGTLTGYAGGVARKEWLLRHEGYLLL